MTTKDRKLSTKEVAEMFGESVSMLKKMRHEGRGPVYYKCGKTVKYLAKDVKAWQDKAYKIIQPRAI